MFHLIKITFLSLLLGSMVYAFDLEEKMHLAQHQSIFSSDFDITDRHGKKLGTLKRPHSFEKTYVIYDIGNHLISHAQAHPFTLGTRLDIYDERDALLGSIEDKVPSFRTVFDLYSSDNIQLGQAKLNFWNNKFTLYDGMSKKVLAIMSRKLPNYRSNWAIDIIDIDRIKEKQIDVKMLLTLLAMQCDIEDSGHSILDASNNTFRANKSEQPTPMNQNIQDKLADFINQEEDLSSIRLINEQDLNILATYLDKSYQQQANTKLSHLEEAEQFVDYCLNYARLADSTPETKKAIVYLLQKNISEK